MSVFDNVRVGGHSQSRSDFFSDAVRLPWVQREESALRRSRGRSSTICNSRAWRTDASPICRSGRRSVSSLRGRWPRGRSCCCSTSRPGGLNHHEVEELGASVPSHPRRAPGHAAAGRASHGSGDVDLRSGRRTGSWPQDRRRRAGRGSDRIAKSFAPIWDRPYNDRRCSPCAD